MLQLTNQFPSLLRHQTPQVTWHLPLNHLGPTTKKVLPVMSLAITMATAFLPSLLRLREELVTCMILLFPGLKSRRKAENRPFPLLLFGPGNKATCMVNED